MFWYCCLKCENLLLFFDAYHFGMLVIEHVTSACGKSKFCVKNHLINSLLDNDNNCYLQLTF